MQCPVFCIFIINTLLRLNTYFSSLFLILFSLDFSSFQAFKFSELFIYYTNSTLTIYKYELCKTFFWFQHFRSGPTGLEAVSTLSFCPQICGRLFIFYEP